jgi:hypothetical protein
MNRGSLIEKFFNNYPTEMVHELGRELYRGVYRKRHHAKVCSCSEYRAVDDHGRPSRNRYVVHGV